MVDITEHRKKIYAAAGNDLLSDMGPVVQAQSKIALTGAVLGFIYAITQRKPWFFYTIGGLVAGGILGYGVDWARKKAV